MVDAAANDALDALEACPCCLLGPQQRCLNTPYTHLDNTEIYSDMLGECFNIQLDVPSDMCGICEECVARLRDASHFKRQVQRSQTQLRVRLARALKIIVEEPPVEGADDSGASGDSADCEPDVNSQAADEDRTSDASSASLNQSEMPRTQATALDGTCSVCLDQMFVDTEHRTCRVGSQTYKLSLYSRSPRPSPEGKGNNSWQSTRRSNLKNAEMETAGEQKASVSRQVYSVANENVGEMPGVKHSKTANSTKETTPYKCSRCKCTGEKPYKCGQCSYVTARKSHLLAHEAKHTGEKPYKCGQCSYASAQKGDLVLHKRKHTGEKPYKCGHCSYACTTKSKLIVHLRVHTGDKPYKCSHCNFASATKSYLVVHERIHTGEKPYKCNRCSYAGASISNLIVHGKKHDFE